VAGLDALFPRRVMRREGAMQDLIHQKNLVHYRKLLAGPTLDDATRDYVSKLLAEEEALDPPSSAAQDDEAS